MTRLSTTATVRQPGNWRPRRAGRYELRLSIQTASFRAATVLVAGLLFLMNLVQAAVVDQPDLRTAEDACATNGAHAPPGTRVERQVFSIVFPGAVLITNRFAAQPLRFRLICVENAVRSTPSGDPPIEECLLMPEIHAGQEKLVITACLKPGEYVERCADGVLRVFDQAGTLLTAMDPFGKVPTLNPGVNTIELAAQHPARARLVVMISGP